MSENAGNKDEILTVLKETMDQAEWSWLVPHLQREALIIVHLELDLLDAAYRIAIDDKKAIQGWIESGMVGKPSEAQVLEWGRNPEKRFTIVVVQPFVLAQEALLH